MNPIMFRGNEHKGHCQEIMREVEYERLTSQNPTISAWPGLGGIIIALMVAGFWLA